MIPGLSSSAPPRRRAWSRPVSLVAGMLLAVAPGCLVLFTASYRAVPRQVEIAVASLSIVWAVAIGWSMVRAMERHLRTLASLVESARNHDFGVRSVHAREAGPLGDLYRQINALIDDLENERTASQELLGVLRRVVDQIDVAILVFGASGRLRLANPVAARLLGMPAGDTVADLAYDDTPFAGMTLGGDPRIVDYRFPGGDGRWRITEQTYRQQGRPARIVFVADVQQVLATEEIRVWQRLIRVIGHEVNNSLAPIASLCQTLDSILSRSPDIVEKGMLHDGLSLIAERAQGLKSFISVYAQVARLPEPRKVMFPVRRLVERTAGMFAADGVRIDGEVPDLTLFGDQVHLEQALINLVRNAVQSQAAAAATGAEPVRLGVSVQAGRCVFEIVDSGTGIANPENLFVPFYTTRAEGAGIGLVLCRSIVAQHAGTVTLHNRDDARGAVARMVLPLPRP
ncbi:PAS domain-containing sensor histidine kinase [Luteibacter flocculans]|uniref:histidine kinase n=1 Tax=Luteibacter flocculans TaxID=2780091 RepID=A0ABY4T473_9GAMM|nr:ATP-binding protein [Luteibacter flocculans]URL59703.1 PAS domain-containing sensor histidine kinase [Luteibacter flocculans]